MSSLAPFSATGTCLTSLHPLNNSSPPKPPPLTLTPIKCAATQLQPPVTAQKESQFKRRDAIGLALSVGILQAFFPPKPASAAVEAPPCELTAAPSGLAFCDKLVGTGPQAVKGQLIKAHYVGRLENGKIFDSSYNRGQPLTFRVGVGEVIKGWDEGIIGGDGIPPMLAGGKRTLKLPPELAYGSRGAGCRGGSCVIPPDSVLLFDVEFVSKV
ncbi:peptidyl-prolyl cis-trans isomerase FKBP13, chloroplastic-like [Lotus japonicus]|uniref:peptidyl-prolyl cis-trans isomerase FKBP13, chloroplastic-like n=1 Tax=Lotus japonicus TaxID=34305 RepID=UPI00258281D3|nr:peptidyl-prolyl cis-trans isomerase FKBP13, chloroplastic-like [Lotus japonicus]